MASKVILLRPSGTTQGFNTIQSAINAAVSGDTLTVYNGVYTEQIIIKNNVNIFCVPGVIITSGNSGGTIIDNGIEARIVLVGEPTISNTGGGAGINLTNLSSDVDGSADFTNMQIVGDLNVTGNVDITGSLKIFSYSAYDTEDYTGIVLQSSHLYVTSSNIYLLMNDNENFYGSSLVFGNRQWIPPNPPMQPEGMFYNAKRWTTAVISSTPSILEANRNSYIIYQDSALKYRMVINNTGSVLLGYSPWEIKDSSRLQVSGSIYASGRIRVGNTSTDIHQLTGSVEITGNLTLNSNTTIKVIKNYYKATTNATPFKQVIDFNNNYLYNYKVSVAAFTTANTSSAGFELSGIYYRNGASSSFISDPNIISVGESLDFTGSLSASVSSSGDFVLTITGKNAATIRWSIYNDSTGVKIN